MAASSRRAPALVPVAILLLLCGLALGGGGIWLIALGGSWYYALAGAGFIATAALLLARHAAALGLYAAIVLASLVWAVWEAGLDWWPLATRGGVVFVLGLLLLLPWVSRPLREAPADAGRRRPPRHPGLPLAASLAVATIVGVVSLFNEPYVLAGRAAAVAAGTPAEGPAAGEWHAYGRTGYGQRYSPLDRITPASVGRLEEVWHYHTGDLRGRPGDPVETTFQVTPLMVDGTLFLCTPHQKVIALDATTGAERWVTDLEIRDDLALQHLTCRGLGYRPATGEAVGDGECEAALYMPTADGRLVALNPQTGARCPRFGARACTHLGWPIRSRWRGSIRGHF